MQYNPNRRTVIAGIGAASALLLGKTSAFGQNTTPIRTQLGWLKTVEFGGLWLADSKGYYQAAGVAPQWIGGGPNIPATPPIVAGGQADVGIDQFQTVAEAVAKGSDFVVLGTIFQESPAGILSLPGNPIEKPADLVGKRIGVQGSATAFIDALLKINGLPVEYTPVPVGFDPTPLIEGACDGFVCFVTNQPIALKLKGIEYVTATYSKLGLPGYSDAFYVTGDFLRNNRAALVGYLEATLRGWTDYVSDVQSAVDITLSTYGADLGLDPKQQLEQANAQVPLIQPAGAQLLSISMDLVKGRMYEGFGLMGLQNLPEPEKLVDLSLLEEASARL